MANGEWRMANGKRHSIARKPLFALFTIRYSPFAIRLFPPIRRLVNRTLLHLRAVA
jgi:hypothetical protein